jgi:pimeloyl-ACP methyl ester carboxylesterase
MLDDLPAATAGEHVAWVWRRVVEIAGGAAVPTRQEFEQHYDRDWLDDVSMPESYLRLAALLGAVTGVRAEATPANVISLVLDLADGTARRLRCVVDQAEPHRIVHQVLCPAMPESSCVQRVVERAGRRVSVRDFGGEGPLLLLWHGSGLDATVWEAVIPHLSAFRVVAQDLPGHGRSRLARLTVRDAIADGDAVVADLALGPPILAGLSLGGWVAVRYAATRPCRALVCLDGPTNLDYTAMGIKPDHAGFPDPPDVPATFASLRCPAMVVLCRGDTPADAERMIPFRAGLAEYLNAEVAHVRVEWLDTGHALVLSRPRETAEFINQFAG